MFPLLLLGLWLGLSLAYTTAAVSRLARGGQGKSGGSQGPTRFFAPTVMGNALMAGCFFCFFLSRYATTYGGPLAGDWLGFRLTDLFAYAGFGCLFLSIVGEVIRRGQRSRQ